MDYLIDLICILFSWLVIHHLLSHTSKSRLPPGPTPLPIVGNLFSLGNRPHESLAKLAKIHGPIMRLQLGRLNTIVISSASVAKEVLQRNDASFCNRTVPHSITALGHHEFSFVFLPASSQWRRYRKITNSHLFTTSRLDASQDLRRKKLEDLLSYVKSCSLSGDSVDVGQATFTTNLNLLSNTFFSIDLVDPNSSNSQEFKELVWQIMVEVGTPNLSDYFPLLKRIDPQGIKRRMEIHFGKVFNLFNDLISQRLLTKGCFSDALDALLQISRENGEELELSHIPHILLDLIVPGSETTPSTIEWAMAELLRNPDKMKKAKEELLYVVGKGIALNEEDIVRLPYLQCVIKETFRMHPPAPLLIPRKTDFDVELCGFTVPKDSQVLVNVWALGRDSSLWENPASFEPERFLGKEIDIKGRDFELLPFGAGRRICPALPLAMRMLPMMLGSLLSCFEWRLEDGVEPETMDMSDKFGITLQKDKPLRAIPISIMQD